MAKQPSYTVDNQLGVIKSLYTVGTFTDYSVTFNRNQESRINQMTLNMEFSLVFVSIHQIMEPAPNMKMLVWKLQNVNQIKIASLWYKDRIVLDFLPICQISWYFVFYTIMPQCHYGFEALQMLPITCFMCLIYSKDVSLPRGLPVMWNMHHSCYSKFITQHFSEHLLDFFQVW